MSVDAFFGAVKEKRDAAIEQFLSEDFLQEQAAGNPEEAVRKGIDALIGGVLDVVEEQYESIVTGNAVDSEGEEVSVELNVTSELSTLYFEAVNN